MRIRERMEARGILLVQLADAMSVSPGAVNKWVYGKANPSADKLPLLARVLGCSIDELFDDHQRKQFHCCLDQAFVVYLRKNHLSYTALFSQVGLGQTHIVVQNGHVSGYIIRHRALAALISPETAFAYMESPSRFLNAVLPLRRQTSIFVDVLLGEQHGVSSSFGVKYT